MQNELESLLRRWTELEPEWCKIDPTHGLCVAAGETWAPTRWMDYSDYIVQGAAQQAIEARGWEWQVARTTNFLDQMFVWANVMGVAGIADTPAAAILTAYLSALEAPDIDA